LKDGSAAEAKPAAGVVGRETAGQARAANAGCER